MLERELDFEEPARIAAHLAERPGFAFLHSAASSGGLGRYSFIGIEPFARFHVRNGVAFWNGEDLPEPPLDALRDVLARFRFERRSAFPFEGGAIGYVAYDFGRRLERLAEPAQPAFGDEICFDFHDLVLAFDAQERRCSLFSSGMDVDGKASHAHAEARLAHALALLRAPKRARAETPETGAAGPFVSNFTAEAYAAAVERVKEHIRAGDIYQANISQRFEAPLGSRFDAFAFFQRLAQVNPAPFAAFLRFNDLAIASASPELFLRCRNGQVETRPIKGTAPRSPDPAEDARRAAALVASEKDRAENVMIVDLLRNDLSRACRPGTVEVPVLCGLESYASLHHLTSVVTGCLKPSFDAVDLLAATFPGGSITGAPKLKAMDIVTAIEGTARGVYCGAIGFLGFDGDMDLNIAIRTVAIEEGRAVFQAGGGVTLLSDGEAEYAETLLKARRIFEAFGVEGAP
ncbi:aminodeoxychorismate synthase component I [Aureimonas psammosilenae]|uniref:aminodeoxychorismate synthase component I n=1 Tax=Aureimonas psammosilenae TaxID=2495496 RepID=UPI0012611761|nr:aminodeoxychorismate synthase component I [Aureimonas psammosilenae]